MLTDLECDYINPIDLANSLNKYVMPEMLVYLGTVLFLCLYGEWLSLLINLPLTIFNITKIINGKQYYDATEVFRTLSKHKRESFFKVGFYLLAFFYYLYCMIVCLVGDAGEAHQAPLS
ncbi:hypothetical protein BB561_004430 [Smittium simulii]|uniref:ER-derived vesicles protein ERV14 n=1 Tax=Smittium simulii TaxID=133385 RepID=A0A2T9YGB0_9FUNG|nr:hypothetical protein BB561_004430 [Smittium simulii]